MERIVIATALAILIAVPVVGHPQSAQSDTKLMTGAAQKCPRGDERCRAAFKFWDTALQQKRALLSISPSNPDADALTKQYGINFSVYMTAACDESQQSAFLNNHPNVVNNCTRFRAQVSKLTTLDQRTITVRARALTIVQVK
jgi:hypothetical protein